MGKLVLISVLVATLVLPMRAARDRSPARGLRHAVLWMSAFNFLYLLAVIYLLPRLQ